MSTLPSAGPSGRSCVRSRLAKTLPARDPDEACNCQGRTRIAMLPCDLLEFSMTRRKWIILGVLLLLLTIGAELLVRPWNPSKGRVQVVNQGDATMDDLVVSYGETKVRVGGLAAGQSTNVWFTAAGKGTLSLEFNQKGNPMKGFQVQDFDPAENLANGFKARPGREEQSGRAFHGR